jgi:hypothetical protein
MSKLEVTIQAYTDLTHNLSQLDVEYLGTYLGVLQDLASEEAGRLVDSTDQSISIWSDNQ